MTSIPADPQSVAKSPEVGGNLRQTGNVASLCYPFSSRSSYATGESADFNTDILNILYPLREFITHYISLFVTITVRIKSEYLTVLDNPVLEENTPICLRHII